MMIIRKIPLVFLALLLSTVGCQNLMTREGIREQDHKKEITEKVTTLQRTTADVNNRFAEVESDIRELHGKVEVLENRVGQTVSSSEKGRRDNDEQVADVKKKMALLQEELVKLQEQIATLAADTAALKSAPKSEKVEKAEKSDKGSFEAAEELFGEKDWKKAILGFQKFREAHPKNKKVPEAIYKTGVSFQELGMKDEAKTFYEELIGKFPKSTEAKKAKIRLKNLK